MNVAKPSPDRSRPTRAAVTLPAVLVPDEALAHASDRGFVLLLPTGHYIMGGALAVAASVVALFVLRPGALSGLAGLRLPVMTLRRDWRIATSLLSFAVLAVLVAAGFLGSRDPLSNPLPLTVWTLFWIGLTLVCGVFGNAFAWIEPWRGPHELTRRIITPLCPVGHLPLKGGDSPTAGTPPYIAAERRSGSPRRPISPLEGEMPDRAEGGDLAPRPALDRLGHLPAILQFLAFAWFELVYPAPDDPARLAWAMAMYWTVNFAAMLVFGHKRWMRQGEVFSVFYRMISRLGVVAAERTEHGLRLSLCVPGGKLRGVDPLPVSGVVFLLAVLASVSFDGLMRTFAWLGFIGINPLEFPGRSAVVLPNTAGLIGVAASLSGAFFLAVWLGERLTRQRVPLARAAGLLVWSIVPIALAYHVSHYLIALLVNGQYALAAISDPFSLGWNLFGTAGNYISVGLVMGPQSAWVLWNLQSAAIVGGHIAAVLIAHGMAARLHPEPNDAFASQIPLAVLMVGYTVFGLWLLSTPTGA